MNQARKTSSAPSWITVLASDASRVMEIRSQLRESERPAFEAEQKVIVIDGAHPQLDAALEQELRAHGAHEWVIVAVWVDEAVSPTRRAEILSALREGVLDDVLEAPLGALSWSAHCVHWEESLALRQVQGVSRELQSTLQNLHRDLEVVERLQRARAPKRFESVGGIAIAQRYLAGARSGGDHFDLAQSKDARTVSMVLTDASSYGLSSAVLSALVRVSLVLSKEGIRSAQETLTLLRGELLEALSPKDSLSVIYGVLSRRDYSFRYVHQGSSQLYYCDRAAGGVWIQLESHGDALRAGGTETAFREQCVMLAPGSRLLLLSDGFVEGVGGDQETKKLLQSLRLEESEKLVTELVYQVKKRFPEEDEMPVQDCTVAVLDIPSRLLREIPSSES